MSVCVRIHDVSKVPKIKFALEEGEKICQIKKKKINKIMKNPFKKSSELILGKDKNI